MSIFSFLKESKKRKVKSTHSSANSFRPPRSPLDDDPEDPEVLFNMLKRTFEINLVEDIDLSQDSEKSLLHTVREGETLKTIAFQYFGDEQEYSNILVSNSMSSEEEDFFVGQILRINL